MKKGNIPNLDSPITVEQVEAAVELLLILLSQNVQSIYVNIDEQKKEEELTLSRKRKQYDFQQKHKSLDEAVQLSKKFKYCLINCNTTLNVSKDRENYERKRLKFDDEFWKTKFGKLKDRIKHLKPTVVFVSEVGKPLTTTNDKYDFTSFEIEGYFGPLFSKPGVKRENSKSISATPNHPTAGITHM